MLVFTNQNCCSNTNPHPYKLTNSTVSTVAINGQLLYFPCLQVREGLRDINVIISSCLQESRQTSVYSPKFVSTMPQRQSCIWSWNKAGHWALTNKQSQLTSCVVEEHHVTWKGKSEVKSVVSACMEI